MTRDEFLSKMWPHALAASQATGLDPRIVMAQAAVESNWGNAAPNNNYFGQKDFSGGGASLSTEEVIDGKRVKINQPFARYDSPEQSFGAYAQNINTHPAYAKLRTTSGYGPQVAELGKSGYATAPNYGSVIDQTAKDLTIPSDVKPSTLQMGVSGAGAGGAGVMAQSPPDVAAPDTPNRVPITTDPRLLGLLAASAQKAQYGALDKQGQGLLAAGAPQSTAQALPLLQAHRPQPVPMQDYFKRGLLG